MTSLVQVTMIPWRRKRRLLLLVLSAVTLMVTCLEFFNVFGPVRGGPARSRSPFDVLEIEEDRREYFVSVQGGVSADGSTVTLTCLNEGVDWNITVTMGNTRCVCKHGVYKNTMLVIYLPRRLHNCINSIISHLCFQ